MALENISTKRMEGILALLNAQECMELAFTSPKMWKIVERTPKKYGIVQFFDGMADEPDRLMLFLAKDEEPFERSGSFIRIPFSWEHWFKQPARFPVWLIKELCNKDPIYVRAAFLRLFLTNVPVQNKQIFLTKTYIKEFRFPLAEFGNESWRALGMKVRQLFNPIEFRTISELCQFLDVIKPSQFIYHGGFDEYIGELDELWKNPAIRSMEKLRFSTEITKFPAPGSLLAKDTCMVLLGDPPLNEAMFHSPRITCFVLQKIEAWLMGKVEIDKFQVHDPVYLMFSFIFWPMIGGLASTLPATIGWIDRTYEGMHLILRATDGQALLAYWDDVNYSFYLIQCQYNFRRGRCLGSYERNQKSLQTIRELMHKLQEQHDKNVTSPSAETLEKLKEECIKFNKYNKDATEMDLLVDSIWRPKGQRESPWMMAEKQSWDIRPVYPTDASLRDAYKFTKVFEEKGVLPDVDQFKPAKEAKIENWISYRG